MVTSHDVARLAGVSQATVSRALRGIPGTSADTLERVRSAADRLGYVPSEAGRSLSTRRTRCIGIVAGELTNPFYPALIEPMRTELHAAGYRTLLVPDDDEAPAERLSDGSLDGVLLTTATVDSALARELERRAMPTVLVNRLVDGCTFDSCSFDNTGGATAVAHHLAEAGHTRIAALAGPKDTSTGRERHTAFAQTLAQLGAPLQPELVQHCAYTYAAGYDATARLLSLDEPPTAIFCGNDVTALGASNAAAAHCDVRSAEKEPGASTLCDAGGSAERLEIIGFDDIPMASWPLFALSTVRGDLAMMARESVRLVLRRLDEPSAPAFHQVLPTRLKLRGRKHTPTT